MRYTYLAIDLLILIVPLLYTFHSRIRYDRCIPAGALSVAVVSPCYLAWDVLAAGWGEWSFNPRYVTGLDVLGLPVEEVLFFVVVPYSCLFIYEALGRLRWRRVLPLRRRWLTVAALLLAVPALLSGSRGYTWKALTSCTGFLLCGSFVKRDFITGARYWAWLGICYIPFLVFNSVLTLLPVVEYDAGAILGPRVGTIPIEDFLYNYSLLSFYGLFYARFRDGSGPDETPPTPEERSLTRDDVNEGVARPGARPDIEGREPVREASINPDHWYAVARADEVRREPLGAVIWDRPVCVFRDADGAVRALEDRCPHRLVRLSLGRVTGDGIECRYHGWRFTNDGRCLHVAGLDPARIPEAAHAKVLPVREQDGFVWVFPGRRESAETVRPMRMPEWDDLDFIASVAPMSCEAHFSFVIENLMDMYHDRLHQRHQPWSADALLEVTRDEGRVEARYSATAYYRIDRIWSALQLALPALRRPHPASLVVSYEYPHWKARLGDDFTLYGVFCPAGPRRTRVHLVQFTSLHRLDSFRKAPVSVRRAVKRCLRNIARGLLKRLISQDVPMVEEEQRAYEAAPERRPLELNRTLHAVQRLVRNEARRAANGASRASQQGC